MGTGAQENDELDDQVADKAGSGVELVPVVQAGVVRRPDRATLHNQMQQFTSIQGVLRHERSPNFYLAFPVLHHSH
jgi:hypothetical protein